MPFAVRKYVADDARATWVVFYAAVHGTASRDYTPEQLAAWAPAEVDERRWHERRASARTFVACDAKEVLGFADFTQDGVLDMLFVRPDAGGHGVARALVETVLREASAAGHRSLRVHASRTAMPVLQRLGFTTHSSRIAEVRGQRLRNYDMTVSLTVGSAEPPPPVIDSR